jgi:hypothetical protein
MPSFIGSDYYCESGNHASGSVLSLHTEDPLWDGQGCGLLEGPCCAAPGLPWFHRQWNASSTDAIELRVCSNEGTFNEDSPVGLYEFYIK